MGKKGGDEKKERIKREEHEARASLAYAIGDGRDGETRCTRSDLECNWNAYILRDVWVLGGRSRRREAAVLGCFFLEGAYF